MCVWGCRAVGCELCLVVGCFWDIVWVREGGDACGRCLCVRAWLLSIPLCSVFGMRCSWLASGFSFRVAAPLILCF